MIKRSIFFIFFFLFFSVTAFAENSFEFDLPEGYILGDIEEEGIEEEDVPNALIKFSHSLNKNVKEEPEANQAMVTLEAGPSAVVANCVNAISGVFFDSQIDLVIPGPQPIVVQRTYCSAEKEWHFQHKPVLRVAPSGGNHHLSAGYQDDNGSGLLYRTRLSETATSKIRGNLTISENLFQKGLSNCGTGEINGQTNWKNSAIVFVRKLEEKCYLLRHGSHIDRVFTRQKRYGKHHRKGAPIGKFHLEEEKHPNGNHLHYSYNDKDQLFNIKAINRLGKPLGELAIRELNDTLVTWSSPSSNQISVSYFFDKKQKKLLQTKPSHATPVSYVYDTSNQLRVKKLPDDRSLHVDYYEHGDEKRRVSRLLAPVGVDKSLITTHSFRYHFTKSNCITDVRDAKQNLTQYHYDKEKKLLNSILRFDEKRQICNIEKFYWGTNDTNAGHLMARSFGDAEKIHFFRNLSYDEFGNVTNDNLFGNLTGKSKSLPAARATEFVKNADEVYTKTYCYSQDGWNLLLEEDDGRKLVTPKGVIIFHGYDVLGRLVDYQSSDGSIHYTYAYDAKDHPIAVHDLVQGTTTKRSYDDYGSLLSETLDHGYTLSYCYDQLDRPVALTLPDNSSVHYHYNAAYLTAIERIREGVTAYTHLYNKYDLAGNILSETFIGKAGEISYQYDRLQRTIAVKAPQWQEAIPSNGYDACGNLLQRHVVDAQGPLTYTYSYDSLYQISAEAGAELHTYQNDSLYNRVSKDGKPYTLNALNQLLAQTEITYHYDYNGNLVEKRDKGNKTFYVYDALDRLIEVNCGSQTTTYTYDSFHRRISKNCDGITTHYLYQGQNEIGAIVNGAITELRILGLTLGAEIGAAIALELQGNIYAPIHDPYGNLVALVDTLGNLVEAYRYTAFGEMQIFSRTPLENPWRFSSKRLDPETGFLYFGHRYYDPEIGRWTTPDPAGFADGPNLYTYAHNHPLAYIDPDGRLAFLIPFALALAADYYLPTAVAFIEPYAGAAVGSFIAGVVNGYNTNFFDPKALSDPNMSMGMAVGAALNLLPGKAAANAAKVTANVAVKELTEVATNAILPKVTRIFSWFKSTAPIGQTAQKTVQVAEKQFAKESLKEVAHVRGFTKHGINQTIGRGVSPQSILDALKNPIKINDVKFDMLGRPSQRLIGKGAEVVVNPKTKLIISVNPSSTNKINKLLKNIE